MAVNSASNSKSEEYFSDFLLGAATSISGPAIALLYFLHQNIGELSTTTPIWQALKYSTTAALLIVFIGSLFQRSRLFGVIAGTAGFLFWSMSWFNTEAISSFAVWIILSAASSAIIWWTAKDRIWHLLVLALAVCAVAFLSSNIWSYTDESEDVASDLMISDLKRSPNIYLFITDGFGRFDQMQKQFGADAWPAGNIPQDWENLGFLMDRQATANYPETTLSIPAMLNGSLQVVSSDNLEASRAEGLKALSGNNRLTNWLQLHGYEYWHAGSGLFDASECDPQVADRCYSTATGSEAQSSLFDVTPLASVRGTSSEINLSERVSAASIGEWAVQDLATGNRPRFVFSHLIEPHPPYSRTCLEKHNVAGTDIGSLSEGWDKKHQPMYIAQSKCLLDDLDQAVKQITTADPKAIVLIQSDHGPAFDITWMELNGWTTEDVWQRFAVFRAVRLPEDCVSSEPQASSLVNTFPLLKGCLEGRTPQLVEPSSFLTRYGKSTVEEIMNTEEGVLKPLPLPAAERLDMIELGP